MTPTERLGIASGIEEAKRHLTTALGHLKTVETLAKRDPDHGRYVVYDMEDATYGIRRLISDLGESLAEFEREPEEEEA